MDAEVMREKVIVLQQECAHFRENLAKHRQEQEELDQRLRSVESLIIQVRTISRTTRNILVFLMLVAIGLIFGFEQVIALVAKL